MRRRLSVPSSGSAPAGLVEGHVHGEGGVGALRLAGHPQVAALWEHPAQRVPQPAHRAGGAERLQVGVPGGLRPVLERVGAGGDEGPAPAAGALVAVDLERPRRRARARHLRGALPAQELRHAGAGAAGARRLHALARAVVARAAGDAVAERAPRIDLRRRPVVRRRARQRAAAKRSTVIRGRVVLDELAAGIVLAARLAAGEVEAALPSRGVRAAGLAQGRVRDQAPAVRLRLDADECCACREQERGPRGFAQPNPQLLHPCVRAATARLLVRHHGRAT